MKKGAAKPDFLTELLKDQKPEEEKKSATPSLSLDQIMQLQEKETKKKAEEKRRREIERRSNDPFNLNYITPMPEDIFVNPKAAVKALASAANSKKTTDLD